MAESHNGRVAMADWWRSVSRPTCTFGFRCRVHITTIRSLLQFFHFVTQSDQEVAQESMQT